MTYILVAVTAHDVIRAAILDFTIFFRKSEYNGIDAGSNQNAYGLCFYLCKVHFMICYEIWAR